MNPNFLSFRITRPNYCIIIQSSRLFSVVRGMCIVEHLVRLSMNGRGVTCQRIALERRTQMHTL